MSILLLVVGILLFISLVIIHELGHFITARRNGVVAEEFGIFFPPRLYKRQMRGGWLFTINALPLGGFVKMKGEHDSDTEPGSFGAASLWAKTKIMAAGVVMNLITALVLLTLLALIGLPELVSNQYTVKSDTKALPTEVLVGTVEKDSPAQKAGLKSADKLVSIGLPGQAKTPIKDSANLPALTKKYAGQKVDIQYVRHGGAIKTAHAVLLSSQVVVPSQAAYKKAAAKASSCQTLTPPKAYLGIDSSDITSRRSTWSAPIVALGFGAQITSLTFKGLGNALSGVGKAIAGTVTANKTARQNGQCDASSQVSGPVGIFFVLKAGSNLGYKYMLLIIAIISLTLAIMNILPIPALDGGRLWITLIARAFGRPLTPALEETVNAVGFICLLVLIALITFVDIKRFF